MQPPQTVVDGWESPTPLDLGFNGEENSDSVPTVQVEYGRPLALCVRRMGLCWRGCWRLRHTEARTRGLAAAQGGSTRVSDIFLILGQFGLGFVWVLGLWKVSVVGSEYLDSAPLCSLSWNENRAKTINRPILPGLTELRLLGASFLQVASTCSTVTSWFVCFCPVLLQLQRDKDCDFDFAPLQLQGDKIL
ncbi:hypothetical protein CXB51_027064 [Gossypium anomalum]|uniref:Uncharacterized protein n=1 Tax=Gossypium anomalum TaxID=47600 RepID=A0A8J5YCC9_9ROSI|nr:hypothetical protein CXB51_027064 [Gossypium anomalum]